MHDIDAVFEAAQTERVDAGRRSWQAEVLMQ